jgi:predicted Zn-dependent protease
MGTRWKSWKTRLVRDYITNADLSKLKTLCDDFNITLEQWEDVVNQKASAEFKVTKKTF